MFLKGLLCLFVLGSALAQEYSDDQTAREQQLAPNYAHRHAAYDHALNHDLYETGRSEPYDFGFQSTDEFGTIMNRQESSDNNGAVRGSYGYTDPFGVFRHVDYVADEFGFRAEVKSNEPGMGTASPANVQIYAEPPPAGVIVERPYYQPGQHGQGGQVSGQQPARRNPAVSASNNANRQVRPATRVPVTNTRTAVYPFVAPQQNAFASNALSSSQYPSTVSNQYASNSAAASASNSQYGAGYQTSNSQYDSGYQTSASAYPARNTYLNAQGFSAQSASQIRSNAGSSQSSSSQQPIVARPYDGPTYKIGNPHVTELVRSDKQESGSILLPSVVTTGGAPTLVKHIHAYPAAPTA